MQKVVYVLSIRDQKDAVVQSICFNLRRSGWEPVIFKGVVGRTLTAGEYFDQIRTYLAMTRRVMSPGEVGCALGHLSIWQTIAENSSAMGIVLEDDAILDDEFNPRVERLLSHFSPVDCFVSLGGQENALRLTRSILGVKVKGVDDTWEIPPSEFGKLYGTVGYLLSRSTAIRLVEHAAKGLFVADDFRLLHRAGVIRQMFLSNVVGHPWGEHHSTIATERDFLFQSAKAPPRPLLRRITEEVMATVSARLTPPESAAVPAGSPLSEWKSRFRSDDAPSH